MRQARSFSAAIGGLKRFFIWLISLVILAVVIIIGLIWSGLIQWNGPLNWMDDFTDKRTVDSHVQTEGVSPNPPKVKETGAVANSGKDSVGAKQPEEPSNQLLGQAQSKIGANANQQLLLVQLAAVKIEKAKMFSFNAWFNEIALKAKIEPVESDLSFLAGLLYEAATKAGLEVGERHRHTDFPTYANDGFDVVVVPGQYDLEIYNPYNFPLTIGVNPAAAQFSVSISGITKEKWAAPRIKVVKEALPPEMVLLGDYAMTAGEVKMNAGKNGDLIKVFRSKENEEPKLFAKDYYLPHPVVVARPAAAKP